MAKKKVTKHVLGQVMELIKKWQKNSYDGNTYPIVDGIIFSNTGSKGREPLFDVSRNKTGDIFAYWKDKEKGILEISAPEPGLEIKAPKSMQTFFCETLMGENLTYLDVTHLDVSQSTDFSYCFQNFGEGRKSRIKGLDTWDISRGVRFIGMFEYAFPNNSIVNLDLSAWKFCKTEEINMASMFYRFAASAKNVELNLDGWQVFTVFNFGWMFSNFALTAENVVLNNLEQWQVGHGKNFDGMFRKFAPQSKCRLDLSAWSKTYDLAGSHSKFSTGTFFKIKEPEWMF